MEDLKGGDAKLNASILLDVFGGQKGAVADALCLNAGVALAAAKVASSPQEGVHMAQVVYRNPRKLCTGSPFYADAAGQGFTCSWSRLHKSLDKLNS